MLARHQSRPQRPLSRGRRSGTAVAGLPGSRYPDRNVTIRLNGDAYEAPGPMTVTELLAHLQIDQRRVAVELNLTIIKRLSFDSTTITAGDEVEIVNFVGGG